MVLSVPLAAHPLAAVSHADSGAACCQDVAAGSSSFVPDLLFQPACPSVYGGVVWNCMQDAAAAIVVCA